MIENRSPVVHLKGLNGIRAIAAFSVVFSHISMNLDQFGLPKGKGSDLAGFGVSIFFALSGFLITYLLLTEKKVTATINIKEFYIRRILRIWPLYFFYIILVLSFLFFFDRDAINLNLLYYIFLSANIPTILEIPLPMLGHYWSLGVEEQFYVFWPWVVKLAKKLFRFLFLFLVIFICLKIMALFLYTKLEFHWPYIFLNVIRFDCMAIGAMGAYLFFKQIPLFLKVARHFVLQAAAWLALILLALNKFHVFSVLDHEIIAALTVILIINVSSNPKTFIRLDNPMLNFLGKISYGIYVYHILLITVLASAIKPLNLQMNLLAYKFFIYLVVIFSTIFIAWLSYTFFELRFLKLKVKYSRIVSDGNH